MRHRHVQWFGLGVALLCVILVGCGNSTTTQRQPTMHRVSTSTPLSTAASSPTATPPQPAVANVYFSDYNHTVYALNPANGSVRWTFSHGPVLYTPIVAGSLVYVETQNTTVPGQAATLTALASANGAVIWSVSGELFFPTVANGALYVLVRDTSGNTAVECLDAVSGARRWQRQAPVTDLSIADDTLYLMASARTSTGAPTTSSLSALNTADGTIRWTFTLDNAGFSAPIIRNSVVYFEADSSQPPNPPSGQLYALNVTDGAQLWSAAAPAIANDYALAGDVLYVGGSTTGVSAYRVSDGTRLWANTDSTLSNFTADSNAVYVNSFQGAVLAFSANTGNQLWSASLSSGYHAMVVANGMLYTLMGGSGSSGSVTGLVVINVSTGAIVWQQQLALHLRSLVLAGGTVYTNSSQPDNGPKPVVYAFNAANGTNLWQHPTDLNLETPLVVTGGLSG